MAKSVLAGVPRCSMKILISKEKILLDPKRVTVLWHTAKVVEKVITMNTDVLRGGFRGCV